MGAPDPHGLYVERWEGQILVGWEKWFDGNPTTRLARANRVCRNLCQRGGWRCPWCKRDVPIYRRADARYCCERCRKAAARQRREIRAAIWAGR